MFELHLLFMHIFVHAVRNAVNIFLHHKVSNYGY